MCGIAGYIAPDVTPLRAHDQAILESLAYRGRDASGVWSDGQRATFLHTRLSIIDLAGGAQPMTSRDGAYTLTFNGEIYNYKELRAAYEAAGARFETQSDTEVILQGFMLKGAKVLDDLNGMFAFAIWSAREQKLFLARDRLGKKPLFWTNHRGAIYFSSTIHSFRAVPGWDDQLSRASLAFYSFLGGFPRDRTAFQNAHALPAGCMAWCAPGDAAPRVETYWRPHYALKARGGEGAFLDEYGDLLTDAVRLRLRSDVPLALTFSGGTDSGTIAAIAKGLGADLECYTIDYDSPEQPSEEVRVACEVAAKLGLRWNFIQFDYRSELLEGLTRAYRNFDQPCQQIPLVYSQRLYERMKPYCTVVLAGNAADEMFTGYVGNEAFLTFDKRRAWARAAPDWVKKWFSAERRAAWENARQNNLSMAEWSRQDAMGHVAAFTQDADVLEECRPIADDLANEFEAVGADTQIDFVMHRGLIVSATDANFRLPDITGYAAQIEVRSPFLDYRMVEFAARLPHRFKIAPHDGVLRAKYLPRRFYERFVGPEIAWNVKKGMGANLEWHLEFARNEAFRRAMEHALSGLDAAGFPSARFRAAYSDFCADVESGNSAFSTAGTMMNGFMFGAWLESERQAR